MLDLLPYLDFRNNPFNLLGLSVQAGAKEIRHRREDIGAALETDTPLEGFEKSKFRFRDLDDIKATVLDAFGKLDDPKERFLHSVFWFWPLKRGTDDYYLKCATGGSEDGLSWAIRGWERNKSFNAAELRAARHNLALAYLLEAKRAEDEIVNSGSSSDSFDISYADNLWREAIAAWYASFDDETIWDGLMRKIKTLDDPRLSVSAVRHLRNAVSEIIPRMLLMYAERLFDVGSDFGKRHMVLLKDWEKDGSIDVRGMFEDKSAEVFSETKRRITAWAKDNLSAKGLDASRNVLEYAERKGRLVLEMFGEKDSNWIQYGSLVAEFVRAAIVTYGNASEDYRACIDMLSRVLPFAVHPRLRQIVTEDKSVFEANCQLHEIEANRGQSPPRDTKLDFSSIRKRTKELFDSITPEQRLNDGANVCKFVICETQPWLDHVRKTFGLANRETLEYCDWIAWFLKETISLYGDATKDCATCVGVLDQALSIACSSDLKRQIESEKDRLTDARLAQTRISHTGSIGTNNSKPKETSEPINKMHRPRNRESSSVSRPDRNNPSSSETKNGSMLPGWTKAVLSELLGFVFGKFVPVLILVGIGFGIWWSFRSGTKDAEAKAAERRATYEAWERSKKRIEHEEKKARDLWASRRKPTPPSGTVRMLVDTECDSGLQIKTKTGANYLVKLVSWRGKKPIETIFVRGGKTVEVAVPSGRYEIRYASGTTWYGDEYLFGPETRCAKADELFSFSKETGYTLTLYEVLNGNLSTSGMSLEDF